MTGLDLYAIAPTMYDDSGDLDAGAMRANVEWLADRGIDRFLLTGAYGEFQSLDDDERVALVEAVLGTGRAKSIMAGAPHPSTRATARLARRLFDAGADLVMVAPPLVAELSTDDIDRHFNHLAAELQHGLVVYNNPVFGTDLSARDLARLADLGAYEAVKQGTTRLGQVIETVQAVRASGSTMRIYAAADLSALATLAVGFDGLTSTNCWVFPDAFVSMIEAAAKQDLARVRALSDALAPYATVVRRLGQPRTVKAALIARGGAGSRHVRLPYVGLSDGEAAELARAIEATDSLLEAIDS